MAAQLGLSAIIRVDSDGAGTYTTLGGIKTASIKLGKEMVDITSQDDTSRYRQLLAGGGVKSATISGSGVFKDDASATTAKGYWVNDTIRNWKIVLPSFFEVIGNFTITDFEFNADHNGPLNFSITLESGGDLTFTAI